MAKQIKNVCVIGLGYVGLSLAVTLAEKGFRVFGIEKNEEILNQLKRGKPHFHEKGLKELILKYSDKFFFLSHDIPKEQKMDCFIIAVSTPIDKTTQKPEMEYIIRAIKEIIPHLESGQLIILRSTIPVGTTRKVVLPMLQEKCKNFYLSFCPERTAEGKALIELKTLPQIIGGIDRKSVDVSAELFSKISPSIVKTDSLETAEIVKLVNNSYRDMIFAYANQIALICKSLGLNAEEVISAANFGYPRSNVQKPGVVGGFCLEKDPHILISSSNCDCKLIKAAKEINEGIPFHILERIKEYLKDKNKSPKEAKIFISGFAFKGQPETDDIRSSQAVKLSSLLQESGISNIFGHDFIVPEGVIKSFGIEPCSLDGGFKDADVIVFMNNHKKYDDVKIGSLTKKMKKDGFIFDGWQVFYNSLKDIPVGIIYESIGFKNKI